MRYLAFIFAMTSAALFGAAGPSAAPPEIVALPEFRVFADRALPEPEAWHYVRVGNFEILSNTSAHTTKTFAKDLYEFQIVMSVVSPMTRIKAELPVTIVLCGKGNTFDKFAAKPTISSIQGLATSLLRDEEIASIVVDYQTSSISQPLSISTALDWVAENDIRPSEEFFRAYVHLALSQVNPRPPAWFAEGLANIYSNVDYNNKWIEIGLPKSFRNQVTILPSFVPGITGFGNYDSFPGSGDYLDARYISGVADFYSNASDLANLRASNSIYQQQAALQPFSDLFSEGYDSPQLTGDRPTQSRPRRYGTYLTNWQRQATAFVHMCLYGENGRYRAPFLKFVARSTREPVTEALFKECFGMTYKQLGVQLRGYMQFTRYNSTIYTAKRGTGFLSPSPSIVVRPATDAEVGRIKGETLRLAGQDAAAQQEFVVAYLRGERDPELLASLGLMAHQRKDDTRARTYLEAVAASASTVPRPRAYLELARLRHSEIQAKTKGPLNATQAAYVLTPLFVTQQLQPQLADIYLEIANVWEHSATPPTRANLGALEYGVIIFPQNGELIYRTAALLIKYGYKADAAPLIQRTLDLTRDPELRTKLELLRQQTNTGTTTRASGQASFVPESLLTPEQRQSLADYRATKASIASELRTKIGTLNGLGPAAREKELAAFALVQASRLNALDRATERLEANLGWPPDENDDYVLGFGSPDAHTSPEAAADLGRLRTALLRPQGLSPPQRGLVQEMILETQEGAATNGAFLFFSPDTARVRFPAELPPELAAQIAAYTHEKAALKQELRAALRQHENLESELVRTVGLGALAEQQAPRFTALESRADAIRRALAQLPPRPTTGDAPTLPAPLAARLAAYQSNRTELQRNARRELRILRSQLPAGAEIVATGEAPRLELKTTGSSTPALQVLRTAIDTFNRDYAGRFAALNRDLVDLRTAIAEHAQNGASNKTGKSIDDLTQDFISAALRQTATEAYQDCYAAVFLPGLSPEQRRLLFGRLGEKHPAFILEF